MKQSLLIILSVFLLTATANTAQAAGLAKAKNSKGTAWDLVSRLKQTKRCPKCNLTGFNLKGANLTGAKLSGANLRKANLTKVIGLRTANLTKANLRRANLKNAKLEGATWTDGRKCAKGSIGKCK